MSLVVVSCELIACWIVCMILWCNSVSVCWSNSIASHLSKVCCLLVVCVGMLIGVADSEVVKTSVVDCAGCCVWFVLLLL